MMATPLTLLPDGQSLETGTPAVLFPVRIAGGPLPGPFPQQYAVSSDGQRFLVNLAADESATSPITLIYTWKPPSCSFLKIVDKFNKRRQRKIATATAGFLNCCEVAIPYM